MVLFILELIYFPQMSLEGLSHVSEWLTSCEMNNSALSNQCKVMELEPWLDETEGRETHPIHSGDSEVIAGGSLVSVQSDRGADLARLFPDGKLRRGCASHAGTQGVRDRPKGTAIGVGRRNLDNTGKQDKMIH